MNTIEIKKPCSVLFVMNDEDLEGGLEDDLDTEVSTGDETLPSGDDLDTDSAEL